MSNASETVGGCGLLIFWFLYATSAIAGIVAGVSNGSVAQAILSLFVPFLGWIFLLFT